MPFFVAVAEMPPLFALLAVMLLSVVGVSLLFLRVKQSLLVAYFLCGVVIANSGILELLGGPDGEEKLKPMAEFGVMLLLFTLGLEFSLGDLKYVRRWAFWGGGLQVLVCLLAGTGAGIALGFTWPQSVILGAALALSSTAISVKSFQDLRLNNSTGARFALAVAIFQDLFVIGFFLIMPLLVPGSMEAGENESLLLRIGALVLKGVIFVAATAALAKWVIPRVLYVVTRSRSRELFTLTIFGLCIGVAFLAAMLDLSLALGAFVAGLAVSETIYKHRILADVQPLKDLFLTLFFVSVGLLMEVDQVLKQWPLILLITVGLIVFKALLVIVLARKLGVRWLSAATAAFSLSSAGEFSVVLLQRFGHFQPWPGEVEQTLLASVAISMGLVPMLMAKAGKWGGSLEKRFPSQKAAKPTGAVTDRQRMKTLHDHAIVCGYGPVGQKLVATLEDVGIPVLIIELNADTVHELSHSGHLVIFADVRHSETWDLARVEHARLVAFTFPNTEVTTAAQHLVREHNRNITILARTKFRAEAKKLEALGVDIVIHDERESARAMVREVLALEATTHRDGVDI
jgi:monovalent cation:H+ antiporter-2, CPA2 family